MARISAVVVSLLYLVVLLPHFPGIGAGHFSSAWFLAGMVAALAWIPLILFKRYLEGREAIHLTLSFAPLATMIAFFSALFAATD